MIKWKIYAKNLMKKIKKGIDITNFIYNNEHIKEELIIIEQINDFGKRINKIYIYVNEENNKKVNFFGDTICQECREYCRINIKDYKIVLLGCKNGHIKNDILLDEYENIQNKIHSNIINDKCIIKTFDKITKILFFNAYQVK